MAELFPAKISFVCSHPRRSAQGKNHPAKFGQSQNYLARADGLVLGLEDLHWADEETLRLFTHLAATVPEGRLLLLGTSRDAMSGDTDQANLLPLSGLAVPDIARWLRADSEVDPARVWVVGHSLGALLACFMVSYASAKANELAHNPRAALNFFWVQLERQIRINGVVEKTSREESEEYFHSRPVGSQLGAWASAQSEVIPNREALERKLAEVTARFAAGAVPLPENWGGYRLVPNAIEFWQGRTNRLHDRFRYSRQRDGRWVIERLSP
jgi:pyridoxamine 5'-phosphate oxidase